MSEVARAARAAVGARFRRHGRDPASGLDCVGLAAWAVDAGGGGTVTVPTGYGLRDGDGAAVTAWLDAALVRADADAAGDLLLLASGPGQLHFAIRTETGFVHADAALRRVVERPGAPPWPVLGRWRIEGRA